MRIACFFDVVRDGHWVELIIACALPLTTPPAVDVWVARDGRACEEWEGEFTEEEAERVAEALSFAARLRAAVDARIEETRELS